MQVLLEVSDSRNWSSPWAACGTAIVHIHQKLDRDNLLSQHSYHWTNWTQFFPRSLSCSCVSPQFQFTHNCSNGNKPALQCEDFLQKEYKTLFLGPVGGYTLPNIWWYHSWLFLWHPFSKINSKSKFNFKWHLIKICVLHATDSSSMMMHSKVKQ